MKTRKIALGLLLAFLVLLSACGNLTPGLKPPASPGGNDPAAALPAPVELEDKGEYDGVKESGDIPALIEEAVGKEVSGQPSGDSPAGDVAGPAKARTAGSNPPPAAFSCSLAVRCDTILADLERFNPEKIELVPPGGVIFFKEKALFDEGESVFTVLLRELRLAKIHLDFVQTPVLDAVYLKAINNLYEGDGGALSGWTYKVNGQFPNYSCASYQLQPGDAVEIVYTFDLGRDVGGGL